MSHRFTVIEATDPQTLRQVYALRHRIYVREMGVLPTDHAWARGGQLRDPWDDYSHHLLLLDGDRPVGTLRLTYAKDGPLEIASAIDITPHGAEAHGAVEITRFMIDRDYRGTWATGPLMKAAWDHMADHSARYLFAAGKQGHLGTYYRNLGLRTIERAEPFQYPTFGTGTYQLLRCDIGRQGSFRRLRLRAFYAAAYAVVKFAPGVAALQFRRGLKAQRRQVARQPAITVA